MQNLLAPANIRQGDHHLAIKTTGTQQGRVQYIRTVSSGDHQDPLPALKAVHLDEQLVERLFTLVITAPQAGTTLSTDRVNFINKDNTWGLLFGLLEHVTHTRRTNPDKHLDKI